MNNAEHLATMPEIEIKAEKWVQNGYTLGHKNGHPVFIVGAIPGEQVLVQVTRQTKKHSFGYVVKSLSKEGSSELKIESDCSVFGECGGCQYRHIPYEKELELKAEAIAQAFPSFTNRIHIHSENPKAYRNNVQWHLAENKYGMLAGNSNTIIPMENRVCLNLPGELQIDSLRKGKKLNRERTQYFRLDANGVKNYSREKQKMQILGQDFNLPAKSFCQINRYLLDPWLTEIKALVSNARTVLELFSGVGMIGLHLDKGLKKYKGYELDKGMVEAAKENAKKRGLVQFEFEAFDLFETKLGAKAFEGVDLVLLNPPRAGAGKIVMESIAKFKVPRVIYSSCHLATLKRDFETLEQNDYQIIDLRLFDFFPRTSHFETLVMAEKTER